MGQYAVPRDITPQPPDEGSWLDPTIRERGYLGDPVKWRASGTPTMEGITASPEAKAQRDVKDWLLALKGPASPERTPGKLPSSPEVTPHRLLSPVCTAAQAFPSALWAPNQQFVPIVIMGVTDPNGDSVTLTVTGVTQDEPVNAQGDGNTSPDAVIEAGAALVRAERSGTGNGRVYQISFRANDSSGGSCTGTVKVSVPHSLNQGLLAIDDGQVYDSTVP